MTLTIPSEIPKLIEAITGFVWPVLAGVVLWKIFPTLRKVIDSRRFTIKLGGMEVSVQEVSENLATQVDDLQKKVTELRTALDEGVHHRAAPQPSSKVLSSQEPSRAVRRVLWVDDQPKNNAFEIAKLKDEGIDVVEATSTSDAMRLLVSGRESFGVVISDMGRREDGEYRAKAGRLLIDAIRRAGLSELPVLVYSSPRHIEKTREEVRQAGGNGATASPVELFEMIHSFIAPAA